MASVILMHVFLKSFGNRKIDDYYLGIITIKNTEISKEYENIRKSYSFQGLSGIIYKLHSTSHNIFTCLQVHHFYAELFFSLV